MASSFSKSCNSSNNAYPDAVSCKIYQWAFREKKGVVIWSLFGLGNIVLSFFISIAGTTGKGEEKEEPKPKEEKEPKEGPEGL